jgi:hypothetical protein
MRSRFIWTLVGLLLLSGLQAFKQPYVMASAADSRSFAVKFELKTNPIWKFPKRGMETAVSLTLEFTNCGPGPVRFPLMDHFQISIQGPDGKVRKMVGGTDGIRPGKPISDPVAPGEKFVLSLSAQLSRGPDDRPRLRIQDDFGGIWWIDPLDAGSNLLRMEYESQPALESNDDIWTGRAVIAPVRIEIVTD